MKFRTLSKDISPKDIPWHIKEKKRRSWTQRDFAEFKKLSAIKFDDAKGEMNLVFPEVIEKFDPERIATVNRKVFDVIHRTAKTITLRERKATCAKLFAGVVTEPVEYKTEPNPSGVIRKATLRKDGKYRLIGNTTSGEVHFGINDNTFLYFNEFNF